jgi:hypothetical protein
MHTPLFEFPNVFNEFDTARVLGVPADLHRSPALTVVGSEDLTSRYTKRYSGGRKRHFECGHPATNGAESLVRRPRCG